jgi:hypothetical protein
MKSEEYEKRINEKLEEISKIAKEKYLDEILTETRDVLSNDIDNDTIQRILTKIKEGFEND